MRKKGMSLVLSLAMVAGLAPNVAKAAENTVDVDAYLASKEADAAATEGPSGDVVWVEVEGEIETIEGVTLDEAVSVEVAARDYDQYESNYVYNRLTAAEKAYYDGLKAMFKKYATTNVDATQTVQGYMFMDGVSYDGISLDRAKELYQVCVYMNPQYYFAANYCAWGGGKFYVGIYNDFAKGSDRATATEKFFARVDQAVSIAKSQPTECLKALAAHDLVCSMTTYDTDFSLSDSGYNQTAWSTFMMDETVCAGYSKAYTIVANGAGVETCGDTSPQGTYAHAWNRAKVDNGWYYVDCTWDDDPDGIDTIDHSFFLIGKKTLASQDSSPAHNTEPCWNGLLPDCPEDYIPGLQGQGIYVAEQDNNKIVAGAVASDSVGRALEYQWQVAEAGTSNWTMIQDWNDSEWLGWAPKRTGDYVLVCNVRLKEDPNTSIQLVTGVNFVINEAHIVGKCQMPWWGEGGGFLIGFTSDSNPNQSYQYEVCILDCTKYANGEDAWVWSSGKHTVSEGNTYWTVWQPEYGYYWTLFIVYDANGTEVGRACYGFENIGQ